MIRAYSDLHGILPVIRPCESLLICGDICPVTGSHDPYIQINYLQGIFTDYCNYLLDEVCEEIVIIPGNHDFIFELPRNHWNNSLPEGVTILIDEEYTLKNGVTLWGSPWVPNLKSWAFYADDVELSEYAGIIPESVDIWMMHGPPDSVGRLDRVNGTSLHVGNRFINEHIRKKKPKGYICGHIHEGFGHEKYQETDVMNVSFLDDMYDPMFRHGIIFHRELVPGEKEFEFTFSTGEKENPKELFYSCRGEVGY